MSFQEKRVWVALLTGVALLAGYGIYVYNRTESGEIAPDDMKFWAGTMLVFIGIGIVAAIVIQIIFHILFSITVAVHEKIKNGKYDEQRVKQTIQVEVAMDEMSKMIELRANKAGHMVAGSGFVISLASQLFDYSVAVMLNLIFVSFFVGSFVGQFTQLYYYRKGV